MRLTTVVIALLITTLASPLAARQPAAGGGCIGLEEAEAYPHVRTIDAPASERLGELLRVSTIVREMLRYLQSAAVSIAIRSDNALVRNHRAGGLSRFFVTEGVLTGRVEFDTGERKADAQRVALAHELGHVVEIATLTRRSTSALGNQLLAHIGRHDVWSPHLVIETPFASDVDRRVAGELKYGAAPIGTLYALAKRHRVRLADCPSDRRPTHLSGTSGTQTPRQKH
jgi:hypothetical protein